MAKDVVQKCKHEWGPKNRCKLCDYKRVDGNSKGGKAERAVAKIIEPWWRTLEPTATFGKTPQSGGWGKGRRRAIAVDKEACGDLVTNSKRFPFCVEVKWREAWSPKNFFDGKPTAPWAWWRQCIDAAEEQDGVPMMWIKRNWIQAPGPRRSFPWLVVIPHTFYIEQRLSAPDIQWASSLLDGNGIDYGDVHPVAYVYSRFIEMGARRMEIK